MTQRLQTQTRPSSITRKGCLQVRPVAPPSGRHLGARSTEIVDADPVACATAISLTNESESQLGTAPRILAEGEIPSSQAEQPQSTAIEELLRCLPQSSEQDVTPCLRLFAAQLGQHGSAVCRWIDEQPLVVAASRIPPCLPSLRSVLDSHPAERGGIWTSAFPGPSRLQGAFLRQSESAILGLFVWGSSTFESAADENLRRAVQLIGRLYGLERPTARSRETPGLIFPEHYIPGGARSMTELYGQLSMLTKGDVPVLIAGETGVGKESIAQILHRSSDRRDGPLVAINCAAIPADLLEAEFFGIEKGVASGVEARQGCFQEASGGILFLDEIGEMPLPLQAKLLRTLQDGIVRPVGGRPREVDVRVISATNVDLSRLAEEGRLRQDLFYRLAGFVLEVPSLRERRADIPGLVESFLRRFAAEAGRALLGVTMSAMRRLLAYAWPGNIRELEQEMRRLAYFASRDGVVDLPQLKRAVREARLPEGGSEAYVDRPESEELAPQLEDLERRLVAAMLEKTKGNRKHAAERLGISRSGLLLKLKRLGLESPEAEKSSPGDSSLEELSVGARSKGP